MQLQDLGIIDEEYKDSGSNIGRATASFLMHQNSDGVVLTGGGNVAGVGGGGLNSPSGNFKFFANNVMSGNQSVGVPATGNGSQTRSSR